MYVPMSIGNNGKHSLFYCFLKYYIIPVSISFVLFYFKQYGMSSILQKYNNNI